MNERIKELANSVGLFMQLPSGPYPVQMTAEESVEAYKKFAELIVRECADTIENRAPGQMGKEGEGWTNGYDDGLKTGAFLIKKHFGVEE